MSKHLFRRSLGLTLSAMLMLTALPTAALAEQTENTDFLITELTADHVTLDETTFTYTGSEIKPNVTVRVEEQLLTLDQDYTLAYADNVEVGQGKVIVSGIATASETHGYAGTVEVPFTIEEAQPEFTLVEITADHVTMEQQAFDYTGEEIRPTVTVTVDGTALVEGKDYALEYVNNLLPGTGTVIVRGIATASQTLGYTGEVRLDFTITQVNEAVQLKPEHVTLSADTFPHTGSAITPTVTVTVDGTTLEQGKHYRVTFANNTDVGTAKVTVTALENSGYTGTVEVPFTIAPAAPVELTKEHVQLEGNTFYHTGKAIEPKVTVTVDGKTLTQGTHFSVTYAENTQVGTGKVTVTGLTQEGFTGTVELTFRIVPHYQITRGSGSKWYVEGTKNLSFTADGDYDDFTGVSVDGKRLDTGYFAVTGDTTVTLKNSFLKKLSLGSHTVTIHFADGEAEGTFRVMEGLDPSNPQTEDTFPLRTMTAAMFVSLTALMGLGYLAARKRMK